MPSPSYSYLRLMEKAAERDRTPRYEREIDDLQRELEFANRSAVAADSPTLRGFRRLRLGLRAILVPRVGRPAAPDRAPEP